MIGNCGVMRLMLAVLLLGAALSCGGGAGPDALPVSALSGVYSVTFAPEETARCPAIRVTLDAQVTWGGCDIEVYTGRREPDHIILQRPIAGLYGFSSIDFYRFESFRGSPARATSAWVAGCKTPNADGTPATCSGTATWVREQPRRTLHRQGDPRWRVELVDTTSQQVTQTVDAVATWIEGTRARGTPLARATAWWHQEFEAEGPTASPFLTPNTKACSDVPNQ